MPWHDGSGDNGDGDEGQDDKHNARGREEKRREEPVSALKTSRMSVHVYTLFYFCYDMICILGLTHSAGSRHVQSPNQ